MTQSRAFKNRPKGHRGRSAGPKGLPAASAHSLHPGKLWSLFKTQSFAFQLACFYLFIEYVRPQSIYPSINILPYAQLALIGGVVAVFTESRKEGFVKSPTTGLLVAYTVLVLLSLVVAYSPSHGFSKWDVFFPWLLAYFLIVNSVTTKERWFLFMLLFLLCSFKMSQHGFRSWAGAGFAFRRWGVGGPPGFFHNSGEIGIQMCIFLPICFCFARALWPSSGRLMKTFLAAMPFTAATTILATNSRGALVGGAAAILWLAVPKGQRAKGLAAAVVLGLLAWFLLPEETLARFTSAGDDATSVSRLTMWSQGLDVMLHHPLLGVGFENWLPYVSDHYPPAFKGEHQLCHNILIQAGAEIGVPGLIVFLSMVIMTFSLNRKSRVLARAQGDEFSYLMAHGLDAGMIGFLVSAQFVTVLYYPYFWIGMPITVALHTGLVRAAGRPETKSGARLQSRADTKIKTRQSFSHGRGP